MLNPRFGHSLMLGILFQACTGSFAQAPTQPALMPEVGVDRAWSLLAQYANPDKSSEDRIQALAALGTMGSDARAAKLIGEAVTGHDMDVRTAAVLAAAETQNPALIPKLQAALDDEQPQVAYAAASTLWKLHDDSGEDLLLAVVSGDRKDKLGFIAKEKHKAAKEMHSPAALAKIGIQQGAGFFLGPFGFGVKAIFLIKKNGGDPDRAAAVDLLAQRHTETVHAALVDALDDHDVAVRAAAARGLSQWPGPETAKLLLPLFNDDKLAVKLTAAAAYIRMVEPHPTPLDTRKGPGPEAPKLEPIQPDAGRTVLTAPPLL